MELRVNATMSNTFKNPNISFFVSLWALKNLELLIMALRTIKQAVREEIELVNFANPGVIARGLKSWVIMVRMKLPLNRIRGKEFSYFLSIWVLR